MFKTGLVRILSVALFVAALFVAKTNSIQAQGTFSCACTSTNPQTLVCANYVIVGIHNCQDGYVPNISSCQSDPICKNATPSYTCSDIPCSASDSLREGAWGDRCGNTSGIDTSVDCIGELTCREVSYSSWKCLKTNIQDTHECRVTLECAGASATGSYPTICATTEQSGSTPFCYNYSDQVDDDIDYTKDCLALNDGSYICTTEVIPFEICNQIPDALQKAECETCYDEGKGGIWTAVGCIEVEPENIVKAILTVGMSIAGGVALLMILASGFLFSTSQGDPKRTTEAKELLTSAIIGLFFIIFSVTILQFIGVTLLRIPGFGGP